MIKIAGFLGLFRENEEWVKTWTNNKSTEYDLSRVEQPLHS